MEGFLTRYLHGNTSIVHVRGNTFGPDDDYSGIQPASKVPDWLRKALASMTLAIPFPGATRMDIIQSLTMDNIKIDFSMVSKDPLVSGDATALLQLPREIQFELDVVEIDPTVYIYLEHDSKEPFAKLHTNRPCPSRTIHRGQEGDQDIPEDMFMVISRINKAPFKVLSGHDSEFEKFLDRVLNKRNSTVYLQGTANALVSSDFGKLMVRDLTFKGEINTIGMQGMKNPPPEVTSISIVKGHADALQVKTKLIIDNPSNIDMNLGAITFIMAYNDCEIGNVTIKQLNLVHGSSNTFESDGYIYDIPDQQKQLGIMHNKMDHKTKTSAMVTFIGDYISDSTKSPLLAPIMQKLVFLIPAPVFEDPPLLQQVQMNLLSSTALVWLRNPFQDIYMKIININASATYQQDQEIGTMYANFSDGGKGWEGPVTLPPCQQDDVESGCIGVVVETPRIPVMVKKIILDTISKALGGRIDLAIDSLVTVAIDSFVLTDLQYKRDNLTAIVKKSF
ncbi:hypothetical protein BC941DRAFT_342631 [Chlamydoabsidia padenii]|nr:hypothetical protein BC941DRAFT_342631 [Chlamydoabsidia padenii]